MSYNLLDAWSDRALFQQIYRGWRSYRADGANSEKAYQALVALHCRSGGVVTDVLSTLLRWATHTRPIDACTGVLGQMTAARARQIADAIRRDGFFVFDEKIPERDYIAIEQFAASTPGFIEGGENRGEEFIYNPQAPISRTYRFRREKVLSVPAVRSLIADETVLAVAQAYLGVEPLLDSVTMWWSTLFSDVPGVEAAQLFHFDLERLKWLKFFFYLTDVTPGRGPHCFVRGSHRADNPAVPPLTRRGYVRLSDAEILSAFGAENVVEITGSRGAVIAVDTRGFHKGKVPTEDDRLVLEFQFANSMFGAMTRNGGLSGELGPELEAFAHRHPNVLRRLMRPGTEQKQ